MKLLRLHIAQLWREKLTFRLALLYLLLVLLMILLLPWLPLPFGPGELDLDNTFLAPFQSGSGKAHLLGTDKLGRDILVNMLYGARTAFFISVPVMLLTALLGVLLGASAGFYGDSRASISIASVIILAVGFLLVAYYGVYVPSQIFSLGLASNKIWWSLILAGVVLALAALVMLQIKRIIPFFQRRITVPLDSLLLRLIEIFTSIPKLVLILVLASFTPASMLLLGSLLVLTYWTEIARLTRAEMLRIKNLPYFEAATSIGAKNSSLLFQHALPNMLAPVTVSFVFGVAGIMALESTLSFLGIGVPGDIPSWGSTISGIRTNITAWWLVLFPGAFLALTVLALQTCSYFILNKIRGN